MLKILVLIAVLACVGGEESNAVNDRSIDDNVGDIKWTEGSSVDVIVGPKNAEYCQLKNNKHISVFDGFGPCRIALNRVTKENKGFWDIWYATPGMVVVRHSLFLVDVVAAPVEPQPFVKSSVKRIESKVLITCSVPEEHEVLACAFRSSGGNVYIASRTEHSDSRYRSVAEGNNCTLQLLIPSNERQGIWRCGVHTTRETRYSYFNMVGSMLNPDNSDYVYSAELRTKNTGVSGTEGNAATLFCSIDAAIRYCYYRSANGTVINVGPSTSSEDYEYVGNGFEAGECGIKIKNLQVSDQGLWSCNVGLTDRFVEQRDYMNIYVNDRKLVEHKWQGNQVVVRLRLASGPKLEYCRFVRNDGLGFVSENVPSQYILYHKYGVCELIIPNPQAVDLRPWTVIAKIHGEGEERSVTTAIESRPLSMRGISSTVGIILWCSFGTIFLFLLLASCLPKKNRQWTAQRAARIRNSFRRQPTHAPAHPQHNVANLPTYQTTQAPIPHHVHTDILTDLPRKV